MRNSSEYFRTIERITIFGCWSIGVLSLSVLALAIANHIGRLGLNLDYEHAWILIIVASTCAMVRIVLAGFASMIKY